MDKRVVRTRATLKSTLIDLVREHDFESINIGDLCKEANINRVTFYTHYHDKYELLDDIFKDMHDYALKRAKELDMINNKMLDQHTAFVNYLQAFVEGLSSYDSLVYSMSKNQSGYIYFAYKSFLNSKLQKALLYYNQKSDLKYPIEQITAFITNGLIGFVIEGITINKGRFTEVFKEAQELFHRLINNNIFIK